MSIREFFGILRSRPPLSFLYHLVLGAVKRRLRLGSIQESATKSVEIKKLAGRGSYSRDWSTDKLSRWATYIPYRENIQQICEVGAWEGLGTNCLSVLFPRASITCIDPWVGSDEHQEDHSFEGTFDRFQANTLVLEGRVSVRRGYSGEQLPLLQKNGFDLIYIDGSHHHDDVLQDAELAHPLVKPGGYLIFDDYIWFYYDCARENPPAAIHTFYRRYKEHYQIVWVGYQVGLQKVDLAS